MKLCKNRTAAWLEQADMVLAFWDGVSIGTKFVIDNCEKRE